ncbi:hypothetical protein DN412_05885 [Cupriavidus lacunae]|uniref:Uncharacterized protein n=1 Tax=Cupriavidus lacunae TaxID=2666307 RepID=A0A370P0H7_9BURK|nr:hypothetical protein DN412_05885 [Cupriavidus lacunae]
MKRILLRCLVAAAVAIAAPIAISATDDQKTASDMPLPGSVSKDDGLKAWQRIQAVITHPRCANCHVGADNVPRWNVVGESKTRLHGMDINAGFGRAGIPGQTCTTCHVTSTAPNDVPHAPPHVGIPWQLAPVQFQWFGKSGAEICQQLRDPRRNGGRDAAGLVEHLRHDALMHGFIPWGWNPGGGRDTPPGTFDSHVKDVAMWGAAGQPCPE